MLDDVGIPRFLEAPNDADKDLVADSTPSIAQGCSVRELVTGKCSFWPLRVRVARASHN